MDLIEQLIAAKKDTYELQIKDMLAELIKYEKLSRSDKFKHITDSPILQKQMPLCWSAFQGNAKNFWLMREVATIMQSMSMRPLEIFNDINNYYPHRKQQQMEIIGNNTQYEFHYYDVESIEVTDTFPFKDAFYLVDKDKETNTATFGIIQQLDHRCNICIATMPLNEAIGYVKKTITDFTLSIHGVTITTRVFSIQGNNDYDFATLREDKTNDVYKVSMPTYDKVTFKDSQSRRYTITLTTSEVQELNLHVSDIQKVSYFIIGKYRDLNIPALLAANQETLDDTSTIEPEMGDNHED